MNCKTRIFLLFTALVFSHLPSVSQTDTNIVSSPGITATDSLIQPEMAPKAPRIRESKRIVAIALCVTLGPFGMHRLYLGTQPQVPAMYAVTLGGGLGVLTVIDLFHLVFSKDISRFKNNPKVIMWAR